MFVFSFVNVIKTLTDHQQLLAFPVLVVAVGRLPADAFQLLLDEGLQQGVGGARASCQHSTTQNNVGSGNTTHVTKYQSSLDAQSHAIYHHYLTTLQVHTEDGEQGTCNYVAEEKHFIKSDYFEELKLKRV